MNEHDTDATPDALHDLPGVRSATIEDPGTDGLRPVVLHVSDAVAPLRALLASDATVVDLLVTEASLTTAFLHLTRQPEQPEVTA